MMADNGEKLELARDMYIGFTFKGKAVVKEMKPGEKMLMLVPKNGEISHFKLLDMKGEDKTVEVMML